MLTAKIFNLDACVYFDLLIIDKVLSKNNSCLTIFVCRYIMASADVCDPCLESNTTVLTAKIFNLDACVYFTVYFRRWWYSCSYRRQINNMVRFKRFKQSISENRDDNRKLLQQKKSLIIKQISTVLKPKLLKPIDGLEERIIAEVASVHEKSEEIIKKEKDELSQLTSILKDIKQELVFLKDHGLSISLIAEVMS
jgi:hypothetical protein